MAAWILSWAAWAPCGRATIWWQRGVVVKQRPGAVQPRHHPGPREPGGGCEPGDFDGDGDMDFVVAAYGAINQAKWDGWKQSDTTYQYHQIVKKTGAINVLPTDLNGDGHLDFVALFAQEHEEISAFINDGKGGFQEHLLFKAATPALAHPAFSLWISIHDGDMDILYTNGDNRTCRRSFRGRITACNGWRTKEPDLRLARHLPLLWRVLRRGRRSEQRRESGHRRDDAVQRLERPKTGESSLAEERRPTALHAS